MTFFVGFKILNSEDLKLLLPDAWLPSVRSTFPFKENTEFVAWRQKLRNSLNFYRNEQLEFFKLFFNKSCENFFFAWLPSLTQDVTAFHETREFHVAANLFFIILQLLQNTPLTSYIQSFSSLFVLDEPLFTFARLKGTIEHLRAYSDCDSPGASKGDYNVDDLNDDLSVKKRDESEDYRSVFQKSFPSIRYRAKLFNCAVILFHSSLALRYKSFWKELIELKSTQRQLSVLYAKIEGANASNKKPNKYILKTFSLLSEDLRELSRDIMWSEVIMFSEENVYILHNFVLSLLEILSEFSESREFAFIPEYYVDALLNSVLALKKNYESSSKTYLPIAEHVLSFLVHHFGDARICNPDVKEFILQTLCKLLKSEVYLCTLENTSSLKMILMKKFLLAFKSRFWVTVSLALSSLLNGSSPRSSDIYNNELLARPSIVMQKCFQSLAINEPETLNMFINNLFNLSCWVITELFVTLQKV
ncbi:uncharacterized protein LOC135120911 [Zophobas morio]|uniref:uncharacterized protein LOC135120911 n=1 Tax=Zophobas morio TaxID=2755281 RepID=UPI00308338D4